MKYGVAMCLLALGAGLLGCDGGKVEVVEDTVAPVVPAEQPTTVIDVAPPADEVAPTAPIPDVVARVEGQAITQAQFERELTFRRRLIATRSRQPVAPSDEFNALVLRDVIASEVLSELARRAGVEVSEETLQADLEEGKTRMGSEEAYQQYLEQEGMTEDDVLAMMRKNRTTQEFLEEATKDLEATEEEMAAEYEKLVAAGELERSEPTTDVSHILIKVAPGADEAMWVAAGERIEEARGRVVAGEDFAQVAGEMSQDPGSAQRGGAYKEVPKGQMVEEFETAMANTPVGELCEPFRTGYGWHVLTVTARHEAGLVPLEEAKEGIGARMVDEKRRDYVATLVADARAAMNIEVLYLKDQVESLGGLSGASPAPADAAPESGPPATDAGAEQDGPSKTD